MHTVMVERRELARLVRMAENRTARMAQSDGRPPEISEIPPDPGNRLISLPTSSLLDRILVEPSMRKAFNLSLRKGGAFSSVANPPVWMSPALLDPAFSVLSQVSRSPTSEEVSDLGIADAFYGFKPKMGGTVSSEGTGPRQALYFLCASPQREGAPDIGMEGELRKAVGPNVGAYLKTLRANRFYCPLRPGFPANINSVSVGGDPIRFFGLSDQVPWASARQVALNVLNLWKVANDYPWPGVVKAYPPAWWGVEQAGLKTLVTQDAPLVRDMIRFWITLATIADYNEIAAIVEDRLKEKVKKAKFNAIVTAVGFAAVGAILTAGVALAFTGAAAAATTGTAAATAGTGSFVQTATTKGLSLALSQISTAEKEKAAEGLMDAAEQLKSTDPAFAKEAEWSAEYLKYSIALQAMEEQDAQAGLPPGTTARPRPPAAPGTGEDKGLIAAVGVAVPALFTAASAFLRA